MPSLSSAMSTWLTSPLLALVRGSRMTQVDRNLDSEGRAHPGLGAHVHPAPVRRGDRRDDREPEPRALGPARARALEALEDAREVLGLDPAALVLDPETEDRADDDGAQADRRVRLGELHGVRRELEPALREALAVDLALGVGARDEGPLAVPEGACLVED